jgi:hypothetical protein
MNVSPEVAERIRRPVPAGMYVLDGSLPVVSFGDPDAATVATLSLNPSWIEFQSQSGGWLLGERRRLASLISLGVDDPRELTDEQVAVVVRDSNEYFSGPNWYRGWFHWLEALLQAAVAGSYLDGSACHLDLVQWATKPAQGELPSDVWNRLVEQDREFLRWQLRNSNVEIVLLNGASIVDELVRAELVPAFDEDHITYRTSGGQPSRLRVFNAVSEGVLFLGWNRPVAGALSADGRTRLTEWVSSALEEHVGKPVDASGAPASGADAPGFIQAGTTVDGVDGLELLLSRWIEESAAPTVGDPGAFGGSPVIMVKMSRDEFVLNRDTKRAAIAAFLEAAARAGGAERLPWHIAPNSRGRWNRVSYRPDDAPTLGWYAYARDVAPEPRGLR